LSTACSTGPALTATLTVQGNGSSTTTAGGLRVANSGCASRSICAVNDRRSGDGVGPSTVVGNATRVDVDGDTTTQPVSNGWTSLFSHSRVARLISARERDEVASGLGSASGDVDLSTTNVELSTTGTRSRVQGDELETHEIVSWSNARGHLEVGPSASRDHAVNTPAAAASVKTLFKDLEPA